MMRRTSILNSIAGIFLFAVFAAVPNLVSAQTTFTNEAEWLASLCGEVVNEEFDFGQQNLGLLDVVLTTAWGEFDYSAQGITNNSGIAIPQADGTVDLGLFADSRPAELVIDPALGTVEGISFGYAAPGGATLIAELADGTLVTEMLPPTPANVTEREFFGWFNTTGQDVVGATIQSNPEEVIFIYGIGFSFGELKDPSPSCQDQLQGIIDALRGKLASASAGDQVWIEEAIYELESAQDPQLWATEDRLSDFGCYFFGNNFYATYYLQCAYDQELVADCLVSIQDLLGCVVDAEIAFALENPDVDSNLLEYAEFFEEYADAFSDAEFYLQAVILHFYAWLFANNA